MTKPKPESEFWRRRKLIRESTLPVAAKLLLMCIADYGGDNGECFAAQETLAWDVSSGDRQLRNILAKLRDIVTVERRGRGMTNLYTIDWQRLAGTQQDRKPTSSQSIADRKSTSGQTGNDRKPTSAQTGNVVPVQSGSELPVSPYIGTQKVTPTVTQKARKQFCKPTVEEVAAYCQERGNSIDPGAFVDHYESNGWKVGKSSMKNWKAAVRTWERNSLSRKQSSNSKTVLTGVGEFVNGPK